MSKKKKINEESFDKYLQRQYGKDILVQADSLVERKRDILKTTISLDISLSGGIPDGTVCLLSGKPKAGKTSLCLEILKNAINDKRSAFYLDIERRCKPSLLKTIRGLDCSKLQMIREQEKQLNAQEWLDILERTIKDNPKAVIVVDSIAMLSTLAERSEDFGSRKDMSGAPKLLASFFRRMQQVIDKNDIVLIFISQLMTNRDPMSNTKWIEKGGVAVQYAVSVWINVTYTKLWPRNDKTQAPSGHDIMCKILSSALGKPYLPCAIPLRYGDGIDYAQDIINNAENYGLIEKSGSWYTIPMLSKKNKDDQKFQGTNKIRQFLLDNPKDLMKLDKEIRSMVLPDDC